MFVHASFPSPLGPLSVRCEGETIVQLSFSGAPAETGAEALPSAVRSALERYFQGQVHALDALTVRPEGSPFQLRVWSELRKVRAGQTCTYAELARASGAPSAAQAVGTTMAKNPIALVIPCHRVVAAAGRIGGYGGGLPRKEWLLRHEGALLA